MKYPIHCVSASLDDIIGAAIVDAGPVEPTERSPGSDWSSGTTD